MATDVPGNPVQKRVARAELGDSGGTPWMDSNKNPAGLFTFFPQFPYIIIFTTTTTITVLLFCLFCYV